MHELSVAMALLDEIEAVAEARAATRVHAATIQVGPLSGVEPALLMRAFEVARLTRARTKHTVLAIQEAQVRVACTDCGCESASSVNNLACPACGARRTRLLQGDELLLRQVELDGGDPSAQNEAALAESPRGEAHV